MKNFLCNINDRSTMYCIDGSFELFIDYTDDNLALQIKEPNRIQYNILLLENVPKKFEGDLINLFNIMVENIFKTITETDIFNIPLLFNRECFDYNMNFEHKFREEYALELEKYLVEISKIY